MKKDKTKIPGLAFSLLKHVLPKNEYVYLNGNFEDMYNHRVRTEGGIKAGIWIWKEIIRSLPGFLYAALYWRMTIFHHNPKKHPQTQAPFDYQHLGALYRDGCLPSHFPLGSR